MGFNSASARMPEEVQEHMPLFKYSARVRATSQVMEGTIDVASQDAAMAILRDRGLVVTSIEKSRVRAQRKRTGGSITINDMVIFCRQLCVIVNAGLPLIEGLNILSEQMENPRFRDIIKQIEKDVESGMSFTEGLAKHPKVFNTLFINLVKAGEASGMLDSILQQLSIYLEKSASLQRKVKSAMIYPSIVISVAVIIVTLLMVKVIPAFEQIFDGFGATLPKPTQILIDISYFVRKNLFLMIIGGAGFLFLLKRYISTTKGRYQFDSFCLNVPVFGVLVRKVAVAKFTRTFSTLLKSGVNILVALEIVAKTAGNSVVEEAINNVRSSIKEGESIAGPLRESGVMPPMVIRMIDVGERTGALDSMLEKIADFYEEQVDVAVSGLTTILEPILIVFLGVVVGGVVIAMFMPLFKMTSIIKGKG